ncbi:hypothetical protein NE237_006658 [Protea cynaroides]|uniref:Two-component response regulator n=1 Tax=Protea cynaroides TaxID=273540 RepID=A0A9Q0QVQ6_9MAGN|nr:hypothetical protein NE237_006658 [Protea cynaroides]
MDQQTEKDDHSKVVKSESKDKEVFPDGMRVLAVDDNIVCLRMLQAVLEHCRYKVKAVTDGATALKLLREDKNNFDIVITDVHMPDMDGFRLLEIVSLEMDIPVIMMSANDDKNMVMKGIKHGARDYLVKPIRKEEIQNIWQHVLRQKLFKPNGSTVKKEITDQNSNCTTKRQRGQSKERESTLNNDSGEDISAHKKPRVVWKPELHKKFIDAVHEIGIDKAVPKKILEYINEPGVSRENIASHLQKFRNAMKKNSARASQQSSNNVDSNGTSGHPSNTTITYPKRITQTDGFDVENIKNLGSIQHGRVVQNFSFFGIPATNQKPFSLQSLNQQCSSLQHYTQVPEIMDQVQQRKHIPGLGDFSSNPLRIDTLHHQTDFNELKYQSFPSRTTMLDDYMDISSHIPYYNASSELSSGINFTLNGSGTTSYPNNICFGGSRTSCTMPTVASTGLSEIVQHDSTSGPVQNFIPGHIQSSNLEHFMQSDNMTSINHVLEHLETESSIIDDEDLRAVVTQFQH